MSLAQAGGNNMKTEGYCVSFADAEREKEFQTCFALLKTALKGSRARIQCVPHDNSASVGVIRILAKRLVIRDPAAFARATALASNYEIYPRTDGTIMFALTFYGMTKKLEG